MAEIIFKYFPRLTELQKHQLTQLYGLYKDWNSKINVISRKDIDNLYERHVLHSLAIGKWIKFKPGTKVMDIGCGGGFPSIPLAIMFPEVSFDCVDSINKKLKVVLAISEEIGLKNITTYHSRVEEIKTKYDFVVCRAVAQQVKLVSWVKKNISSHHNNVFPNGLVALKGGNIKEELRPLNKREYSEIIPISDFFSEDFFEEKFIVYTQLG